MSVLRKENLLQRGDEALDLSSRVPSESLKEKKSDTSTTSTEPNSELVTFWRRKGSSEEPSENVSSETESEEQYVPDIYTGDEVPKVPDDPVDITSASSTSDIFIDERKSKKEVKIKKTDPLGQINLTPKDLPLTSDGLQCLSTFFNTEEQESMLPPDAVLSIEDKYFAVLPNTGTPGHTLFQSICQVVTKKDTDYKSFRENVVDYICSSDGWDILGPHIMSTYSETIPELNSPQEMYSSRTENRKRLYHHYFMQEEMEGSLVELIAAAIKFNFNYTCIILQEVETVGSATCRVFHSVDETTEAVPSLELLSKKYSSKSSKRPEMNYFLRVGQSQNDWQWTLIVPYLENCFDRPCHSHIIPRGTYQGELWNVFGLNWSKGNFLMKRQPRNHFAWRAGLSVLPTSSGKLLGRINNTGTDLFSILCWFIPECVHVDDQCLMKDSIRHCPPKLCLKSLNDSKLFAAIVLKNKRNCKKKEKLDGPGTLEDLHKASKIYSFGYYVIGVDEYGDFQSLARADSKNTIIYLLARTKYKTVTDWCALGDMRVFKRMSSEESLVEYRIPTELPPPSPTIASKQPSRTNSVISLYSSEVPTETGSMKRLRLGLNNVFSNLRRLLPGRSRQSNRSRARHRKVFPLSNNNNEPSS